MHAEELLRSSNITEKFCTEDWDSYSYDKVTADYIENLLKAKFYTYQHNALKNKTVLMAGDRITVPTSVHFVREGCLYDPMI